MIHILHSIGWAVLAFCLTALAITAFVVWFNTKTDGRFLKEKEADCVRIAQIGSLAAAAITFLLTL